MVVGLIFAVYVLAILGHLTAKQVAAPKTAYVGTGEAEGLELFQHPVSGLPSAAASLGKHGPTSILVISSYTMQTYVTCQEPCPATVCSMHCLSAIQRKLSCCQVFCSSG